MATSHRSRTRSRSPDVHPHRRRRSPHTTSSRRNHRHRDWEQHAESRPKRKRDEPKTPAQPVYLPFRAKALSKHDLPEYRATFASYLDIQKQLFIEELSEDEVRGRWKSFIGKWNRGELAEGWYDPATRRKANESASLNQDEASQDEDIQAEAARSMKSSRKDAAQQTFSHEDDDDDDEDEDDYAPSRPPGELALVRASAQTSGPSVPNFSDLALRDEMKAEEELARRKDIRHARKADRKEQREKMDELAPRAEPGTKERQLEKKRENAAAARSFRDAKGGAGEMEQVPDSELMGGGEGGAEEARRMRREAERKKNERELRREEVLRARAAEREERLKVHREKEDKTMEMLKAIAKERFG